MQLSRIITKTFTHLPVNVILLFINKRCINAQPVPQAFCHFTFYKSKSTRIHISLLIDHVSGSPHTFILDTYIKSLLNLEISLAFQSNAFRIIKNIFGTPVNSNT